MRETSKSPLVQLRENDAKEGCTLLDDSQPLCSGVRGRSSPRAATRLLRTVGVRLRAISARRRCKRAHAATATAAAAVVVAAAAAAGRVHCSGGGVVDVA